MFSHSPGHHTHTHTHTSYHPPPCVQPPPPSYHPPPHVQQPPLLISPRTMRAASPPPPPIIPQPEWAGPARLVPQGKLNAGRVGRPVPAPGSLPFCAGHTGGPPRHPVWNAVHWGAKGPPVAAALQDWAAWLEFGGFLALEATLKHCTERLWKAVETLPDTAPLMPSPMRRTCPRTSRPPSCTSPTMRHSGSGRRGSGRNGAHQRWAGGRGHCQGAVWCLHAAGMGNGGRPTRARGRRPQQRPRKPRSSTTCPATSPARSPTLAPFPMPWPPAGITTPDRGASPGSVGGKGPAATLPVGPGGRRLGSGRPGPGALRHCRCRSRRRQGTAGCLQGHAPGSHV